MNTIAKVLIVDDDEILRRYYRRALAGANFTVQVAMCGDEALEILADENFDVVIVDHRMRGSDGLAVVRAIKDLCPDTEVVVIAGAPSVKHAKEAIRLGACDYLSKPVRPDEVISVAARAAVQKKWTLHRVSGRAPALLTH